MSFYNDPAKVQEYIAMCDGYDGSHLYKALQAQLPTGSSLLEFGSGAGFDIEYLQHHYQVTGSDLSDEFLRICQQKFPDINFLKLDVLDLNLNQSFDCLFSNKVLHHLSEQQLLQSLNQQRALLTDMGIIAHTFWLGDKPMEMEGMLFNFYREKALLDLVCSRFKIISTLRYGEFEDSDSIFIIAKPL